MARSARDWAHELAKRRIAGRSCKDKQRHVSMGAAEAHLRALDKLGRSECREGIKMVAYACGFCDGWHVGHSRV